MPSSGLGPWARAAGPPAIPLAIEEEPTAVMNPRPTRGPIMRRSSQKAREAISSRNSLAASQRNLREGKEDLLQPGVGRLTQTGKGTQFGKRAPAPTAAAA